MILNVPFISQLGYGANQAFLKSYLVIQEPVIGDPMQYNATVKWSGGLNVRSAPSVLGVVIGSLANGQRIFIESVTDGWGKITYPLIGYVSFSIILDPIPSLEEVAIRVNELQRTINYAKNRQNRLNGG